MMLCDAVSYEYRGRLGLIDAMNMPVGDLHMLRHFIFERRRKEQEEKELEEKRNKQNKKNNNAPSSPMMNRRMMDALNDELEGF